MIDVQLALLQRLHSAIHRTPVDLDPSDLLERQTPTLARGRAARGSPELRHWHLPQDVWSMGFRNPGPLPMHESGHRWGETITDTQRIAHLEEKVEFLDLCVTDLRRSVEALHTVIDEIRLEQIHLAVRAGSVPADTNG